MAALAGISLAWPGTGLGEMWKLKPRAYASLVPLGRWIGVPFLLLGVVLATAAIGWFKRQLWGWKLAVGIIATQALGDAANLLLGRYMEGGVGVIIAGALLIYLLRGELRAAFGRSTSARGEPPPAV